MIIPTLNRLTKKRNKKTHPTQNQIFIISNKENKVRWCCQWKQVHQNQQMSSTKAILWMKIISGKKILKISLRKGYHVILINEKIQKLICWIKREKRVIIFLIIVWMVTQGIILRVKRNKNLAKEISMYSKIFQYTFQFIFYRNQMRCPFKPNVS